MFVLCFCKAVILVILKGLENEVNTAPYASNLISTRQESVSILAVEILEGRYDVLSPCIVSTKLPALQRANTCKAVLLVISGLQSSDWRQGTICYISTPRTLLVCLCTLVAYLCAVSIIAEPIISKIITTCIVKSKLYILVKCITNTSVNYLIIAMSVTNPSTACTKGMITYASFQFAIVVKNFCTIVSCRSRLWLESSTSNTNGTEQRKN